MLSGGSCLLVHVYYRGPQVGNGPDLPSGNTWALGDDPSSEAPRLKWRRVDTLPRGKVMKVDQEFSKHRLTAFAAALRGLSLALQGSQPHIPFSSREWSFKAVQEAEWIALIFFLSLADSVGHPKR